MPRSETFKFLRLHLKLLIIPSNLPIPHSRGYSCWNRLC